MAQLFHPSTNVISKLSIVGGVVAVPALSVGLYFANMSYATEVGVPKVQPVEFSHKHHVAEAGIDCRYCHSTVDRAAFAGMPSTHTCMTCHSQLWVDSPELEPVRESFRTGRPIEWTRVHDLPDFAYFDHSIHIQKGVSCVSCHGRVDQMPLVWKEKPLTMAWCLDCHRDPEPHLRPREYVFQLDWKPKQAGGHGEEHGESHAGEQTAEAHLAAASHDGHAGESGSDGESLREKYNILSTEQLTNCSTCHR